MQSQPGFKFRILRSGAPVAVDPTGFVIFREAEGTFVAPDKVETTVKVIIPGIVAEVSVISIGGQEWETNILTGEWQEVPGEFAFKPAVLFDPAGGIQQVLDENLTAVELLGTTELEELPGLSLYHLSGKMDGTAVHALTFGLIDEQPLDIELWIAPDTFELVRVTITDPIDEGADEPTVWQLDFWDYGTVVEIEPPL